MKIEQPASPIATADAIQGIRAALPDKPRSEITVDDVSAAVTAYLGTVIPMDKASSVMLKKLTKKILEHPLG